MKKILVLTFSELASDPRVRRHIDFLKGDYEVTAVGFGDADIPGVRVLPLIKKFRGYLGKTVTGFLLLSGMSERYYWRLKQVDDCIEKTARLKPDLVIANDIDTLPVALKIADGAKVLLDAHEYSPGQLDDSLKFRLFYKKYKTDICKRYIGRTDTMITVSAGIAERYAGEFGLTPTVVTNATEFHDLSPSAMEESKMRMVHHGGAIPSRKIESMINMMKHLDARFRLDLILVNTVPRYLAKLKNMAAGDTRISFLPPVPMKKIPSFLNRYDIGLYILPPMNFNSRFALPNKLFEFVQARLAIAIGPSEEMARVVQKYDLGIVAPDFRPGSMASILKDLDKDKVFRFKTRSHMAAKNLSSDGNRDILLRLVKGLIGG